MSVIPVLCDKDGMLVRHRNHIGRVPWTALRYGQDVDGSVDRAWVAVPCPEGDAVSYHPITGGANAELVERAFVYGLIFVDNLTDDEWHKAGFPGKAPTPPYSWGQAKQIVKAAIMHREPERWRLENVNEGE